MASIVVNPISVLKLGGETRFICDTKGIHNPRIEVLARVNEFRRNADLKSLGLDEIE